MRTEEFTINCTALAEARETLDQCLQDALTRLSDGKPEASVTLKINLEVQPYPDGTGLIPVLTHKVTLNIPDKFDSQGVSKPDKMAYKDGTWVVQDLQRSLFDED